MRHLLKLFVALAIALSPGLASAQTGPFIDAFGDGTGTTLTGTMLFGCGVGAGPTNIPTLKCNFGQINTYLSSSTQTLTNKTFNTGATGNVLQIAGSTFSGLNAALSLVGGNLGITANGITSAMMSNVVTGGAGSCTSCNLSYDAAGRLTAAASGSAGGGGGNVTTATGTPTVGALAIGNGQSGGLPSISFVGSLGTTTTVYHGNAAGAGSFGAVNFAADMTGNIQLTNMNGGTGAAATTVFIGSGSTGAWGNVTGPMFGNTSNNFIFAGACTGTPGSPTLRAMCIQDLPPVPYRVITLATDSATAADLGGVLTTKGSTVTTLTINAAVVTQGNTVSLNVQSSGNTTLAGDAATAVGLNSTTAVPGTALTFIGNSTGTLDAFGIQTPTASRIGGVRAITCGGGSFVSAIGTDGLPVCSSAAGGGDVVHSGTWFANSFLYATGSFTVATTAAVTNGQLFIGSTGNPPVAAVPSATLPVTVSPGAGTLTFACATCTTSAAVLTANKLVAGTAGTQAMASVSELDYSSHVLSVGASGQVGKVFLFGGTSAGGTTINGQSTSGSVFQLLVDSVTNNDTIATLATAHNFTASQRGGVQTITLSTVTYTPNFDTAQNFTLTVDHTACAASACTIANPSTTPVAGQSGMFRLLEDSTGCANCSPAWGTQYFYVGGTSAITLSTGANAFDYVPYYVADSTHIILGGIVKGATH